MVFPGDQPAAAINFDAWWDRCAKLRAPLLRKRFARCISTVRGEIIKLFAIILLVNPEHTSSRICVSRAVSETFGDIFSLPLIRGGAPLTRFLARWRVLRRIAVPIRSYAPASLVSTTKLSQTKCGFPRSLAIKYAHRHRALFALVILVRVAIRVAPAYIVLLFVTKRKTARKGRRPALALKSGKERICDFSGSLAPRAPAQ